MPTSDEKNAHTDLFDELYLAMLRRFHTGPNSGWPGHDTRRDACHMCKQSAEVAFDVTNHLAGYPDREAG